jgi:hypothetical protein
MKRDIETRLKKLEAQHKPRSKPIRYICCYSLDECEEQQRQMIQSGIDPIYFFLSTG